MEKDKTNTLEEIFSTKFCIGCKSIDHFIADCPKDPNIKTAADIFEERARLELIFKMKDKKKSIKVDENHVKVLKILENKMFGSDFIRNIDSDDEKISFQDLIEIKEELALDRTSKWFVSGFEEPLKHNLEHQKTFKSKRQATFH